MDPIDDFGTALTCQDFFRRGALGLGTARAFPACHDIKTEGYQAATAPCSRWAIGLAILSLVLLCSGDARAQSVPPASACDATIRAELEADPGALLELIAAGHELTVWNRSRAASKPFEGRARIAPTPQEAMDGEVVVTMLADDAALEAVWLAPRMTTPGVHLNMATVSLGMAVRFPGHLCLAVERMAPGRKHSKQGLSPETTCWFR